MHCKSSTFALWHLVCDHQFWGATSSAAYYKLIISIFPNLETLSCGLALFYYEEISLYPFFCFNFCGNRTNPHA